MNAPLSKNAYHSRDILQQMALLTAIIYLHYYFVHVLKTLKQAECPTPVSCGFFYAQRFPMAEC
ncbi:hypothetical protein [Nitrosomonas sp. Nm34]|uniref:hypothetical protein n=1 Tax=Nitrosomonas sp. Nm34 TaxID=1881055 RepID=UPI0008E776A3|nr:hypothetical protein [Nitrosomonas sp. Nm34]SFI96434.1 hypothetical protein SAMN05428978_106810 [Nitrosomonas sp. Nm34]